MMHDAPQQNIRPRESRVQVDLTRVSSAIHFQISYQRLLPKVVLVILCCSNGWNYHLILYPLFDIIFSVNEDHKTHHKSTKQQIALQTEAQLTSNTTQTICITTLITNTILIELFIFPQTNPQDLLLHRLMTLWKHCEQLYHT